MRSISDAALEHLRYVVDLPDLEGTRYDLLHELGRGGMGTVYKAYDRMLDREVAVKVLASHDRSHDATARMLREARVIARLEHPGIVPVHDAGLLLDGRAYYAMKLVRGQRLDHHITPQMSLTERLRIFLRICEPVAFAHARGVVHRDLKPANIMVGEYGELLIMDWGVATTLSARDPDSANDPAPAASREPTSFTPAIPAVTADGTVIGTPGYMAPEQERGQIDVVDTRSDVFALGAILDGLCTGYQQSVRAMSVARVPRPIAAVVRKATAHAQQERYTDAGQLADEIARYLDGSPVGAYRENLLERGGRWIARHRLAVALVLAYLLMRFILLITSGR